jgi:hypothetical protein
MSKDNYFVGVRLNKDLTLYNKIKQDPLPKSELIRKALSMYFEEKPNSHINNELVESLNKQVDFLQNQIDFLHKQNAFLSLPWYKKIVYMLGPKKEVLIE